MLTLNQTRSARLQHRLVRILFVLISFAVTACGQTQPQGKIVPPLWTVELPNGATGESYSLLEHADRLFLLNSLSGDVMALSKEGELLWAHQWQGWYGSLEMRGNDLYIWAREGANRVLDAENGTVRQEKTLTVPPNFQTMAVVTDTLYGVNPLADQLFAVDSNSGQTRWITSVDKTAFANKSYSLRYILTTQNMLFLYIIVTEPTARQVWYLQVYDRYEGKWLWSIEERDFISTVPWEQEGSALIAYSVKTSHESTQGPSPIVTTVVDTQTGTERWHHLGTHQFFLAEGQLYHWNEGSLERWNWQDGRLEQKLNNACDGYIVHNFSYCEQSRIRSFRWVTDHVYDGWVTAVNLNDGSTAWSSAVEQGKRYRLIGVTDTLVVTYLAGKIVAFAR